MSHDHTSQFSRRALLQLGAKAAAGALTVPAFGAWAAPTDTRFVLVFLRGAYDGTNALIPAGSSFYYEARPTLAIKAAQGTEASRDLAWSLAAHAPRGGGKGLEQWAVHPALRDSLLPMWQAGQLAFVPFAGTPDLSRSHFETQESIENGSGGRAQALGASVPAASGFLGRLAEKLGAATVQPVSFTQELPTVWQGGRGLIVPNMALVEKGGKKKSRPLDESRAAVLAQMYKGSAYEGAIAEGFDLRREIERDASHMAMGGVDKINQGAVSTKGFSLVASRMGRLMRERYRMGFIDVGGWDTHVNQGAAQGALAGRLEELGNGLAAMQREMGPAWDKAVVMVISEFGRTMRENGNRGTDHGHGTAYWALGGGVRGGQVAGEQVAITARSLNEDRDMPVLNDYRAVLGGVFKRLYGTNEDTLGYVFPGKAPVDLGLLA